MTIWVLIITIGYSKAIATQEFTSRERCEVALVAMKDEFYGVRAVCVPK